MVRLHSSVFQFAITLIYGYDILIPELDQLKGQKQEGEEYIP